MPTASLFNIRSSFSSVAIPFFSMLVLFVFCSGCANLRDTHERLHGVLWIQNSAEYQALSAMTYQRATEALDNALHDRNWTAAMEQTGAFQNLPPAVILDLDETVLDNSPFEGRLIKDRTPFNRSKWDQWVAEANAQALPGAVQFIIEAQKRDITILFVTNRRAEHEISTRLNLEKLGIILRTDIDAILSEGEALHNWPADKSSRRQYLTDRYRILLLIGDDLGDFVSGAMDTPTNRIRIAQQHMSRWGRSWFLIPNPIYGSWEASLYPRGLPDDVIIQSKRSLVRDSP